jgi:hypothetical protein
VIRLPDSRVWPGFGLGVVVGVSVTTVVTGALLALGQPADPSSPAAGSTPTGSSGSTTPTESPPPRVVTTPFPSDTTSTGQPGEQAELAVPALPEEVPAGEPVTCPPADVSVRTAKELTDALAAAEPGQSIHLEDGIYTGAFVIDRPGTSEQPVFLCGGPGAVLAGEGVEDGYVLHLDGVAHWRLVGFTVRNGQKGVMADGTTDSVIQSLTVEHIGDEGIHLRAHSCRNAVLGNTVRETGLRRDKFGEGIYVGSARSNWSEYSDGEPDRSDHNLIQGNDISDTAAESVDIKEGTTGGAVVDNTFDGSAMTGGDSWVDVKGNGWLIASNVGHATPEDGFQTHRILDGWGMDNVFVDNESATGSDGLDFFVHDPKDTGNKVACSNRRADGAALTSNVNCVARAG